jgi:hypothetical protein
MEAFVCPIQAVICLMTGESRHFHLSTPYAGARKFQVCLVLKS